MEPEKFTADDLKRWLFADIEAGMTDGQREAARYNPLIMHSETPRQEALKHIAEIVYSYSSRQDEDFAQTKGRLEDAKHLFSQLLTSVVTPGIMPFRFPLDKDRSALLFEKSRCIWEHRGDLEHEFLQKGYREDDDSFLFRPYISNVAAKIIERPWLASHFMEWVIVDSLVCDQIRQLGRSILGSDYLFGFGETFFVGRSALSLKGMEKVLNGKLRGIVIRWLLRFILLLFIPAAGIWCGLRNENLWILFSSALIMATYLLWSAFVTVLAAIMRLLAREPPKTPLQRDLERLALMNEAYRTLAGPVVDPMRVKKALEAAAEKGAMWDEAIYAVLNRVIGRDPGAWVTNDSHSYRGREDHSR